MTKDEAERRRWTFYEAVTIDLLNAISSQVNGISFGSSLWLRLSPHCVVEKCEAIDRE